MCQQYSYNRKQLPIWIADTVPTPSSIHDAYLCQKVTFCFLFFSFSRQYQTCCSPLVPCSFRLCRALQQSNQNIKSLIKDTKTDAVVTSNPLNGFHYHKFSSKSDLFLKLIWKSGKDKAEKSYDFFPRMRNLQPARRSQPKIKYLSSVFAL